MNNKMAKLIFFSIVLIVLLSVNYYIFRHTRPVFEIDSWVGVGLKVFFIFLVLSYPIGRVLERVYPSVLSELVTKIGAFWLGAMVYLILAFLIFDLVKLLHSITGFPSILSTKNSISFIKTLIIGVYATTVVLLLSGYINALNPRVNKVKIIIDKAIPGYQTLRIGMASDIHLGSIISNGRLERFVRMMNNEKPDIILLAGDIFDEDLGPVIQKDMGKLLSQLSAPLGVYAVTGNHEYIGGVKPAVDYLEQHGIIVVRDTAISINSIINIVGREDRQSKIMAGFIRKPINSIVADIDKNIFTVLMDHQPYNLNEAVENGIDLQVSGHTHHGQMFPFNLITKSMFEVSRGYKLKKKTHIYVSTGFGTWGPPVRIGNRPEIVVIEVRGN
jgi:hypothetical protein